MMDYFFFFESCVVGGTEMLIEKLGNYYTFCGAHVVLVCNNILPEMEKRLSAKNIIVVKTNLWNDTRTFNSIVKNNSKSKNVFCITFNWQCYIVVTRSISVRKKTLLFSTHTDTLRTDLSYPLSNFFYRLASILSFRELIRTHRLVLQDEQTVETICNCFGEKYKKNLLDLIIRIPVDIPPLNLENLRVRSKKSDLCILTIARADFPFKGYIIGLVELMRKLENAQLTIISYGPDERKIEKHIEEMPKNVSDRIKLVGQTDFDSLEKYIEDATLYIGMGTTVLDATLRGVLSIAVYAYTYEVKADGFFFDDVLSIIGYRNEKNHKNMIHNLINHVYNMTEPDYYQNAMKGREAVIHYYSTEFVAECLKLRFNEMPNDSKSFSSWVLYKFYHYRLLISCIIRKLRRQAK